MMIATSLLRSLFPLMPLDDNRTWSHKQGKARITQGDQAANPIPDPRNSVLHLGCYFLNVRNNRRTVDINGVQ